MTRTIPHGRRALGAACALALVVLTSAEAHARFGDLDPGFNGVGVVAPSVGTGPGRLEAIATRPDGRPVAAGSAATDAIVVQRTVDGAADASFGAAGVVRTPLAARLYGVAVDGAGQVWAAGVTGQSIPVVLRLGADGSSPAAFEVGSLAGEARAVLPLADGTTLVAGWRSGAAGAGEAFFLARLTAAGALDSTFGSAGFAPVPPFGANSRALAMAVDAAGRIVLAGRAPQQAALARYEPGGLLDPTFGTRGMVELESGELRSVGVDAAGRIVAAGVSGAEALVVRRLADGAPDGSFGSGGATRNAVGGAARLNGLVLDGDRALAAGATGAETPLPLLGALDGGGVPDAGLGGAPPGWRTIAVFPGLAADVLAATRGPGGTLYGAGLLGPEPLIVRTLPNAAPSAALTAPAQAAVGAPVAFDAGGSSDAEGEPLRYAFDLDGDGSYEHDAGAGAVATRSFPAAGTFTVGVRVTDPRGASATAARAIVVAAATAPRPILGKQGVARPLRGIVRIRLPGKKRFVRLRELAAIPNGTEIDVSKGRVLLTVVRNAAGKLDSARFYGGRFIFRQAKGRKPVTTLRLSGGKLVSCRARAAIASAGKGGKKRVRKLWGDGKGRFRTRGRYGAATVRGTKWLTKDRCDGTLVRVARGKVGVESLGVQAPSGGERVGPRIVKAGGRALVPARRRR